MPKRISNKINEAIDVFRKMSKTFRIQQMSMIVWLRLMRKMVN
jgi:hypothetical protein